MTLGPPRFDHDDGLQTHPIPPPLQAVDAICHGGATPFHLPVACGLGLVRARGTTMMRSAPSSRSGA
jgi:hypothetical protein